jgi:hypothetical protein
MSNIIDTIQTQQIQTLGPDLFHLSMYTKVPSNVEVKVGLYHIS